jgi:hypothetical protein
MAAYHVVLVHFPIALWMTAALAIVIRALSDGLLAKAIDRALVPLLALGLITGLAAYAVGLMVWPWEALSATPLGRNHMLLATWTVAYWTLILVTRWVQGEAIWRGPSRYVMAGLAVLGTALLAVTGTLGGHLVGQYTPVVEALRYFGWEPYTTFYVPTVTLLLLVIASLALIAVGWWSSRQEELAKPAPQATGKAEPATQQAVRP